MTTFADAIADVKNGPVTHPLYNVVEIAFKAVWTIRDAATVSRTLRKAEASRYEYLGDPWEAIGDELYSEDFAELRDWLASAVADYRKVLKFARGSNLPGVKPAKAVPRDEPVTHYVKAREPGKRNFVFVTSNGESRLKIHAARFTLTSALAAIAELACENPGWQFKAVRIDGEKYGEFTAPIIPQPSPVSFTAPVVKAAAIAPEATPDTYTPIRPVAESATATPENVGHTETASVVEIRDASYAIEHKPDGIDLTKLVSGEVHQCRWTPDGVADCTCPGFRFNGGCRHLCYAQSAGLIPTPAPVPVLPESAPADPCDIRPGHPEYTIEDEHARVRAIIVGAPILVYHLPESGPRRVDTLGWVVADHVSRLLEIQRDGQHGRDDSGGVGWTASLLWDAMPTEERDIFGEWIEAIGYDPTEDFAGLPTEEQWDVFAGCCITGTPIRTIPPGSDPGPGEDATIFADQSRDFVASGAEAACPLAVLQTDPIISRAPLDAIDLIGAHAMNTLPALSGGSDEASPGPKYASPGSIVLFWHCPACRKSGPVETALPAARPEVSVRARQDHRTDSPDCPGVPDVGFPDWMPEDGTPGTIRLPVGGGAPDLPEDCPCPECGGSGVAGGQFTEGGEETSPCTLCEGTGRYSPTELPEEEYDRLVAAATPSNETLRRMIRDRKPPEATAPPDSLLEDLERGAREMSGDRPTSFEDRIALTMKEAAEEIRRLRARDATLAASCKSWLNAVLVHNRSQHNGMTDGHLWQAAKELRETIKAVEPDWVEPEPKL